MPPGVSVITSNITSGCVHLDVCWKNQSTYLPSEIWQMSIQHTSRWSLKQTPPLVLMYLGAVPLLSLLHVGRGHGLVLHPDVPQGGRQVGLGHIQVHVDLLGQSLLLELPLLLGGRGQEGLEEVESWRLKGHGKGRAFHRPCPIGVWGWVRPVCTLSHQCTRSCIIVCRPHNKPDSNTTRRHWLWRSQGKAPRRRVAWTLLFTDSQ